MLAAAVEFELRVSAEAPASVFHCHVCANAPLLIVLVPAAAVRELNGSDEAAERFVQINAPLPLVPST